MAIARNRPGWSGDNSAGGAPSRSSQYSDAYLLALGGSKNYGFADEGSYFSVLNTTPGTGIAGHAAPSSADPTKPILWLFNGGNLRVSLDLVAVRMTAIGAGASTTDFSVFVDTGATRVSGGTAMTPRNVNSDSTNESAVTAYIGPTVLVNASARHIAHRRVRSVVPVVEDQYVFSFGYGGYGLPAGVATSGTNIAAIHVSFPAVSIGPGDSLIFVEWGASQSGAHSFDFEVGYVER